MDLQIALQQFEQAAHNHAVFTENGNYKEVNRHYRKIINTAIYINNNFGISVLDTLLLKEAVGIRLWSAGFLLGKNENALAKLERISKMNSIHGLTAETTLSEWKKGNLKMLP